MRILSWNCNNGINKKIQIDYFKSFNPDIAVIPELKKSNIERLSPHSYSWVTNNHINPSSKGLGILTFNGYTIEELPRDDDMEIYIPVKVTKDTFSFNLLAVWNFYHACKQGRFKNLKGLNCLEYTVLEYYKELFASPCLIVGDWNLGPTFSKHSFIKILNLLNTYGIKSLYHECYKLSPENTKHSTFHSTRKTFHHLDHIFGSPFFIQNMSDFMIDDFKNVVLSDHAPLILDIKTDSRMDHN